MEFKCWYICSFFNYTFALAKEVSMITTRILGKKVSGKNFYQCLVAIRFLSEVNKTTTITDIEKQVKPKVVNYLGLLVDQFLIEKANNKNRS